MQPNSLGIWSLVPEFDYFFYFFRIRSRVVNKEIGMELVKCTTRGQMKLQTH